MEIKILQTLEGAKKSEDFVVVIDVFRAFTVECFLYYYGAKRIYPMGDYNECLKLREKNPDYFLVGERKGIKLDGFDCGNSPSHLYMLYDVKDKNILHSTSSGTQGIMAALNNMNNKINPVTDIITGSLVNANAIVKYIKKKNPKIVSLVAMGYAGLEPTDEDTLCAEYIKYLLESNDDLENKDSFNIQEKMLNLKNTSGAKFFDLSKKASFPLPDYFMCLMPNVFDFVLEIKMDEKVELYYSDMIKIF